jgi:hypothetical protein
MTPIEILATAIDKTQFLAHNIGTGDVLVPEQCMELIIDGRTYHITAEDITDLEAE